MEKIRIKRETDKEKKQRYNAHYRLRLLGYQINVKHRMIFRPDVFNSSGVRIERILTRNDNYSIHNKIL